MAKGQQRSSREAKKPKKEKPKIISAASTLKGGEQTFKIGQKKK